MVKENIVHVNYEWQNLELPPEFNTLSNDSRWKAKVDYVCDIIEKNRNGNLVLDLSAEGKISVTIARAIIHQLNLKKEEVKLIFSHDITNTDFFSDYNVEINYLRNCNWANFYKKLCAQNIDWQSITLKHYFLSLVNRPSVTRALYTKSLLEHFKDESLISFGLTHDAQIKSILEPYKAPIRIDFKAKPSFAQQHDIPNNVIFESLFNIVHETNPPESTEIRMTEKTFKAFAWHQIPIFIANKKVIDILRSFGFDLFDDILEHHAYSSNLNLHHIKVMALLKRLTQKYKNLEELQQLRNDLFFRLSHNNNLLEKLVIENGSNDWICMHR